MSGFLRLATAGSVDDGKSTLVGRLLYDTKSVLADQLAAVDRASRDRGLDGPDLALLTDGLRAEREQGITIDVAYRYFATATRRFVLADTPGHVQYTRNMVTGASVAEVVVILADARAGVVEQTQRHTAIVALLRAPHVVLAVNKMDLVAYDEEVFAVIADEFSTLARGLGLADVTEIPVAALHGDNIVTPSVNMEWYGGPTLLEYLEAVRVGDAAAARPARLPVQVVLRGDGSRGYAGTVASGTVAAGDEIVVLPAGNRTRVAAIDRLGRPVDMARAGDAIAVRLEDDLDVARGDLLAAAASPPRVTRDLTATVCWLAERTLRRGERILVKHTTRTVPAVVRDISHALDIGTLTNRPAGFLGVNDIGGVALRLAEPLAVDAYADDRNTGGALLIDAHDGGTLAAALLLLLPVEGSLQPIQAGPAVQLQGTLHRRAFDSRAPSSSAGDTDA